MKTIRIIPRLDIKGPNLVKGIHLEGLRVLGKPEDFAQYYYENGADELFYQDVVASLYERNSLGDIITATAKKSFIPLTVAGGIRTLDDIKNVLRVGADKVCINTAAIKRPSFIEEATKKFGSSTIVVAIEAIQQPGGQYQCFIDNGREHTGIDAIEWAKQVETLGAGEILITSVDREGTGKGMDLELINSISNTVGIPVIAHGGIGCKAHAQQVAEGCNVEGIAIASVLHYDFIANRQSDMKERTEGNVSFLNSGRSSFGKFETCNIEEIKALLNTNQIICRP